MHRTAVNCYWLRPVVLAKQSTRRVSSLSQSRTGRSAHPRRIGPSGESWGPRGDRNIVSNTVTVQAGRGNRTMIVIAALAALALSLAFAVRPSFAAQGDDNLPCPNGSAPIYADYDSRMPGRLLDF